MLQLLLNALLLVTTATAAFAQAPSEKPLVAAKLYSAHQAVKPGGETELAIELKMEAGWHVYHRILIDAGIPANFTFTLPQGVTVGEVRFPKPQLHTTAGLQSLVHEDGAVFLAPITVGPDVKPGQELEIKVEVTGLVCKVACLDFETSATLKLPVQPEMGAAANAKLFQDARESLPTALSDARFVKGSQLIASQDAVRPGDEFELAAIINIEGHHHILDREAGIEFLIPSRFYIEQVNGFEFKMSEQAWPPPRIVAVEGLGKARQHEGRAAIRQPIKFTDPKFPPGPVTFHILFEYQCCDDKGQCYPREIAEASITINVVKAGTPVTRSANSVFSTPLPPPEKPGPTTTQPTQVDATPASNDTSANSAADAFVDQTDRISLPVALALGLFGGLILNIMPCVLPVISIKVLSFVQQGGEDPKRVFRLGMAFCAGIMVWFWAFAALSAVGTLPLQDPVVVIALGSIMFVFALNLFGVFELTLPGAAAGRLDGIAAKEGYTGAFFKGLLATLLGTACTAPLLAPALAYTFTQPAIIKFLVFSAAGLGMAFPYLLLSANPRWLRFIPKPGYWMVRFKQLTGFVLIGTAIWLLWVLRGQLGGNGVLWTVSFWSFLSFAAWIIGAIGPSWEYRSRMTAWLAAIAIILGGLWFSFGYMYEPEQAQQSSASVAEVEAIISDPAWLATWDKKIPWIEYRKGLDRELSLAGYAVYVDYTARWCLTCQANKTGVLETEEVRGKMREFGVIPIHAGFDNRDPEMFDEIKSFGRPGVPLNVLYPTLRPKDVIILPALLTRGVVLEALQKAGPSVGKSSKQPP